MIGRAKNDPIRIHVKRCLDIRTGADLGARWNGTKRRCRIDEIARPVEDKDDTHLQVNVRAIGTEDEGAIGVGWNQEDSRLQLRAVESDTIGVVGNNEPRTIRAACDVINEPWKMEGSGKRLCGRVVDKGNAGRTTTRDKDGGTLRRRW